MKWSYILAISWRNLMDSKIRTILTIMGVVIGVSAVTFLVALGYGFERMTTSQVASDSTIRIVDVNLDESDLASITETDLENLAAIEDVTDVLAAANMAGRAAVGNVRTDVVINAYTNEYYAASNLRLLRGISLSKDDSGILVSNGLLKVFSVDINNYESAEVDVTILANNALSPTKEDGEESPYGKAKIKGVIDDSEGLFIVLPFAIAKERAAITQYNAAKVEVAAEENLPAVREKINTLGFTTNYIGDTIAQINSFFTIFRYVIGGFGVIGMLVAILGMFNTLTVSLLERTREIGVLKSNGATGRVVWKMFITEAVIISSVGGLVGVLIGSVIGETINYVFNLYALRRGALPVDFFFVPPVFVVAMLIFVFSMGFFTGLYPSRRASKIRVLDALKYE